MLVRSRLIQFLRGLGDLIFPPVCVHCRAALPGADYRHLCPRCSRQIAFVAKPCCETCGHPFGGAVRGVRGCPHCAALVPAFGRGRAAVVLRGPARTLLLELKYHRGWHVLDDIEAIFRRSELIGEHVRGGILVPVPLHPRRQRERGFNQSALLARALARASGAPCRPLLRRVADTPSQTAFDRRRRQANLKNAFALAPGEALNPRQRYILVDDVFTTGSTLNSCARALRRAGGVTIDVVVFAHG